MRKIFFLLSVSFIFNYVCADLIKIPLKENPDIRFLQQKLYTEEVTINWKVEVLYNVVEFYCLEGLVIVKLPDNSIKYVGDESTMDNLKCIHFNSWEKALDGE